MHRFSWNMEASTSWKLQGLFRPVMGLLYLLLGFPAFTAIRSRRLNASVMKRTSGRSLGTFKQIMSWIFRQHSTSTLFVRVPILFCNARQWTSGLDLLSVGSRILLVILWAVCSSSLFCRDEINMKAVQQKIALELYCLNW